MALRIINDYRSIQGEVTLPASKSISNRVLILNYISGNFTHLINLSDAGDTVILKNVLGSLDESSNGLNIIDVGNAGTAMRFLTALLAVRGGNYLLTGSERMKQRPLGPLVEALRQIGCRISYTENEGFPPIEIEGAFLKRDKIAEIDASLSSQFVSALMMAGPLINPDFLLRIKGKPSSRPYIGLTLKVMSDFGYEVKMTGREIMIRHGNKPPGKYEVEADWSAAAFWFQAAALADKAEILLKGIRTSSFQGDRLIRQIGKKLGIASAEHQGGVLIHKTHAETDECIFDFSGTPDLAIPVIIACAVGGIPGIFCGLENLRIKESDRLEALQEIISQIGARFKKETEEEWRLTGRTSALPQKIFIKTKNDHRIAMSGAMISAAGIEVSIDDEKPVSKSYPQFWHDLANAGFKVLSS